MLLALVHLVVVIAVVSFLLVLWLLLTLALARITVVVSVGVGLLRSFGHSGHDSLDGLDIGRDPCLRASVLGRTARV